MDTKSIKTTAAGAAVGIPLIVASLQDGKTVAQMICGVVAGLGVIALGYFARDWNIAADGTKVTKDPDDQG